LRRTQAESDILKNLVKISIQGKPLLDPKKRQDFEIQKLLDDKQWILYLQEKHREIKRPTKSDWIEWTKEALELKK